MLSSVRLRTSCTKYLRTARQRLWMSGMVVRKGAYMKRIALTYENGEVFQHFGHMEEDSLFRSR